MLVKTIDWIFAFISSAGIVLIAHHFKSIEVYFGLLLMCVGLIYVINRTRE